MKGEENLLGRFLTAVADIPPSTSALVAVSGGCDSVVLLDLLRLAKFQSLTVAHFHHGLRGAEATADSAFVAELSQRYRLPCLQGRGHTRARAARRKQSLEQAARELRRAFLAKSAKKRGATIIFLAHHAGDVAETMLFHLARGGGLRGLTSLRSTAPLDATGLVLIRPLLGFTRGEIEDHAKLRRLGFRQDESNFSRAHTRNRLRLDALPALTTAIGHDPIPPMARAAEILEAEDDWLESLVAEDAAQAELTTSSLRRMPVARQRRLLRAWLREQAPAEPNFATIERARNLALSTTAPAKINLAQGQHLRRRAGKIFIQSAATP